MDERRIYARREADRTSHQAPVGEGWISVEERLPDEDEDGTSLIGYFQYTGGSHMVGAISTKHLLDGVFQGRCTHWMHYEDLPLPPAPEKP